MHVTQGRSPPGHLPALRANIPQRFLSIPAYFLDPYSFCTFQLFITGKQRYALHLQAAISQSLSHVDQRSAVAAASLLPARVGVLAHPPQGQRSQADETTHIRCVPAHFFARAHNPLYRVLQALASLRRLFLLLLRESHVHGNDRYSDGPWHTSAMFFPVALLNPA